MSQWNPVEGLEEIAESEIQVGDVVVEHDPVRKSYTQMTVDSLWDVGGRYTYYLLGRKVEEPTGIGDIVVVEGETYVRVRDAYRDNKTGYLGPWSDEANNNFFVWEDLVKDTNGPVKVRKARYDD